MHHLSNDPEVEVTPDTWVVTCPGSPACKAEDGVVGSYPAASLARGWADFHQCGADERPTIAGPSEPLDPAPKHYPGIPRQWTVTLSSGQQLLVRFTDETETDIEVAYRGNEWARWSPATPGVPA